MKFYSDFNYSRLNIARTILLAGLIFVYFSASAMHYSHVTVNSSDGDMGRVYASESNSAPDDSKYAVTYTGDQQDAKSGVSAATHTWYLFAMPVSEAFQFDGWYDANGSFVSGSLMAQVTVNVPKGSGLNSPHAYATYNAKFSKKPVAVVVKSNNDYLKASISKLINTYGDRLTVSCQFDKTPYNGANGVMHNPNLVFDGWYDANDNLVSTEMTFSFIADSEMELTARGHVRETTPKNGKYYRVRNIANRVLSLEGNYKIGPSAATSYLTDQDVDASLMRWVLPSNHNVADYPVGTSDGLFSATDDNPPSEIETMPSALFYFEGGKEGSNKLEDANLYCQGTNLKSIISNTVCVFGMSSSYPGYHYMRKNNTLTDANDGKLKMKASGDACIVRFERDKNDTNDSFSALVFEPVDEEHLDENWFGVSPDPSMLLDGGYWTSMYTAFPYECRDGVEAYYATAAGMLEGKTMVQLVKIADGRVPANSGVLLKCASTDSRHNRLLPLPPSTSIAALNGNLLRGSCQLYTNDKKGGRQTFDTASMRVLGCDETSHASFMKMAQGAELAANKAWLDASGLPDEAIGIIPSQTEKVIDGYFHLISADGACLELADKEGTLVESDNEEAIGNAGAVFYVSVTKGWEGVATVARLAAMSTQGEDIKFEGFESGKMITEVSVENNYVKVRSRDKEMILEPIDSKVGSFSPELEKNEDNHQYRTFYLDFPVHVESSGVKYYTVSTIKKQDYITDDLHLAQVAYAEIEEVMDEDGYIPALTPFVAEMTQNIEDFAFTPAGSAIVSEFKLVEPENVIGVVDDITIVNHAPRRVAQNQDGILRGVLMPTEINSDALGWEDEMGEDNPLYRLQPVAVGQAAMLGFAKADEGTLAANEAYLKPGEKLSNDLMAIGEPDGAIVTGIKDINKDKETSSLISGSEKHVKIYNMEGTEVRDPKKGNIYIIDGRKVILL